MEYEISILTVVCISIIGALSLNLIVGFCGQISLGHAAFIGIGAYTSAAMTKAGIPFVLATLSGMGAAAVFGFIVGFASLRVRHDFLAITTMGVGFLFTGIIRKQEWLGGEMGIAGIPGPGLGKVGFMVLTMVLVILFSLFCLYLKKTWMGYTFDTIADDEDTANMLGINVSGYKLIAFALGTAFAGLTGVLYAHNVKFIDPESFGFIESITFLSMVIIGGSGSVWGVILAATVLSVFPLWFQFIDDYKLLVYGGLLCIVMLFNSDGINGMVKQLIKSTQKSKEINHVAT